MATNLTAAQYIHRYGPVPAELWAIRPETIGVITEHDRTCVTCGLHWHGPNLEVIQIKVPDQRDKVRYEPNMLVRNFDLPGNMVLLCKKCKAKYLGGDGQIKAILISHRNVSGGKK